ncbi:Cuticle Protein CPR RR Uncl [Hyalella azteca]|nr:Cuticle Protein CPR RR Uncl [Hyalella azteca]
MIYNYKSDHLNHEQTGVAGKSVSGGYGWTAPNGQKFSVNYIADNKGYRIVSSHNVFPGGKPLNPVETFPPAPKSFPSAPKSSDFSAPAPSLHLKSESNPFTSPNKPSVTSSSSFFSPQTKNSLARAHFGLAEPKINESPTTTTTTTTRRPVTVIFFNTTPKAAKPSSSVVPVPSKVVIPQVNRKTFGGQPSAPEVAANEAKEPAAEETEGADTTGPKNAKSVAASEGGNVAGADGAEAEGASAGSKTKDAGSTDAAGEKAGGAEAEAGAAEEGAEGGGEGEEGAEAGAEDEGAEAEGEEAEAETGVEAEEEEESGSDSAGEDW